MFRAASLSNEGDAPGLLAHPEYLRFTGDGIAEGRTRVIVATMDASQRVAGFATWARGPGGQLEVEDLFVHPQWRRRGIARRLVEDLAATARREGHTTITVIGNQHAQAFYQAVGFVQFGSAETALGLAPTCASTSPTAPEAVHTNVTDGAETSPTRTTSARP